MIIDEIKQLVDDYTAWLRDRTTLRSIDDWVEITTPYLDRHNDSLQIYAKRQNGEFLLTDDGYTLDDLELSGCKLDSQKRQSLLQVTLNGFGVRLNGFKLEASASTDNFSQKKHNLIQAMLAVNDMFYMSSPLVLSLFLEDVVAWLDSNNVRFTPRVKFTGRSGYDHMFDFVIPKSRVKPERIVQAINRPSRETVSTFLYSWVDTREVRSTESTAYALLNDTEQRVPSGLVEALRNYDVSPVPWSLREQVRDALVA